MWVRGGSGIKNASIPTASVLLCVCHEDIHIQWWPNWLSLHQHVGLNLPLPRASLWLASYWDICSVWETKKQPKPYCFHPRHCPCLAFWDNSVRGFGFSSSTLHIQTQLLTRFKKFIEFSDVEKWHLKRDPEELVLEKVTVFNPPVTLRALAKWLATLNYGLCFSIFNRKLDFLWSSVSHTHMSTHTHLSHWCTHTHRPDTHTHLYTYTYTHAHIYICTHTYIHANTHKHIYTLTRIHTTTPDGSPWLQSYVANDFFSDVSSATLILTV